MPDRGVDEESREGFGEALFVRLHPIMG